MIFQGGSGPPFPPLDPHLWTLIREQSDLGPYCLQYRIPKYIADDKRGENWLILNKLYRIINLFANGMDPDRTVPSLWNSPIWVHSACKQTFQLFLKKYYWRIIEELIIYFSAFQIRCDFCKFFTISIAVTPQSFSPYCINPETSLLQKEQSDYG